MIISPYGIPMRLMTSLTSSLVLHFLSCSLSCYLSVFPLVLSLIELNTPQWCCGFLTASSLYIIIYQPSIGASPLNWFKFPPIPIIFDSHLDGTDDNDIDCAPILTFEADDPEGGLAFPD